ncbi:MAG: penicillin-binding protein 2 [Anaerolineae bacterium]|nr:penicillin-binding protein 2 [Anaerolineae bacterium]
MDRSPEEITRQRWTILIVLFSVCAIFFMLSLIVGQFVHADKPSENEAPAGQIQLPRGALADRNGFLLAFDVFRYDVEASPANLSAEKRNKLAEELVPIINKPRDEIRALLETNRSYVTLATGLGGMVESDVKKLSAKFGPVVKTVPHPLRYYPEGPLAAHVLGFVNAEPKGCYGVEEYYQRDLHREPVPLEKLGPEVWDEIQASDTTLILTIDRYAQRIVEEELDAAMKQTKAVSGQVIVMIPKTGEILAMASRPTYNPAEFLEAPPQTWVNPAVSEVYEPGSVFKLVTYAAALDAQVTTPNELFYDPGVIEIGGRKILNWDKVGHGTVDITEALGNSLNVVAATISQRMGKERFYTYVRRFGFGQRTEIDLAGEAPGIVKTPYDDNSRYSDSDLGTNSFGQGISVTPIQMVSAVASIANGGVLMSPQVVRAKVVGGQVVELQPRAIRRTISSETARTLTALLVRVVDEYMPQAKVPGYSIAGKTGTAEIPMGGVYDPNDYIASFAGYGPATDPQLVILVKLDRPQTVRSGGGAAAPVFQRIASRLFKYLAIPPDRAN